MFVVSGSLLLFFSSRRRHTRCALVTGVQTCALPISDPSSSAAQLRRDFRHVPALFARHLQFQRRRLARAVGPRDRRRAVGRAAAYLGNIEQTLADRKSVVWGKSVSVRVDLGGCRIIKKKQITHMYQTTTISHS